MAQREVLFLLCVSGMIREAPAALVQTQRTVMAAAGDGVRLSCRLTQQKDVLQVTWKKLSAEGGERSVATCSKYFGQRVSSTFRGEAEFEEAGLQNSSIMIREVTEQDEGCYHCLFNTFPQGALTGTTCLRLQALQVPVPAAARVEKPNSSADVELEVMEKPDGDVKLVVVVVVVLVIVLFALLLVIFCFVRRHWVSRSRTETKTPQKSAQTPKLSTPLMESQNKHPMLTSAGKKKLNDSLNSSPGGPKCQRQLSWSPRQ